MATEEVGSDAGCGLAAMSASVAESRPSASRVQSRQPVLRRSRSDSSSSSSNMSIKAGFSLRSLATLSVARSTAVLRPVAGVYRVVGQRAAELVEIADHSRNLPKPVRKPTMALELVIKAARKILVD